jgi:hypothetical protein
VTAGEGKLKVKLSLCLCKRIFIQCLPDDAIFTLWCFRLLSTKEASHHVEDNAAAQPTMQEHFGTGLDGLRLGGPTVGRC